MAIETPRHGPFKFPDPKQPDKFTPDQSDGFMEPLPGRLPFEEIVNMNEEGVDKRLAEHLKDKPAFTDKPPHELSDERIAEIKRVFLAVLEGYQPGGESFAGWFEPKKGEVARYSDIRLNLERLMSDYGSQEFKQRRQYTAEQLLYETEMMSPTPDALKKLDEINTILERMGMRAMAMREIFLPARVFFSDKPAVEHEKVQWTVDRLLDVFLLKLQGETDERVGERFGVERPTIYQVRLRRFTPKAQEVIRRSRHAGESE